jgi:hypothetical protein
MTPISFVVLPMEQSAVYPYSKDWQPDVKLSSEGGSTRVYRLWVSSSLARRLIGGVG